MTIKKTMCSILAATLIVSGSLVVNANEMQYPTLTLEKAIKDAKKSSIALEQNDRQQSLKVEEADYADLMYGYDAYQKGYVERRYTEQQQDVIEKQIERNVRQLFDDILYNEESMILIKEKVSLQEKVLKENELKKEKGLASELEVKKAQLQLNQLKEEQNQLETLLNTQYADLCTTIGESTKKYTLEKEDNTYEAFEFPGSIDALVETRAEKHLDLWKAKENIRLEDLSIYTYDYMTLIRKNESREQARDNMKLTKQALEQQLRTIYTNVKQLETNYEIAKKNLVLKEKEMKINDLYLEKGMMSKVEYDKKLLEYEQSKLDLKKIVNQHTDTKELLNRPYLISMGQGA